MTYPHPAPPPRCDRHRDWATSNPCRDCADAAQLLTEWRRDKAEWEQRERDQAARIRAQEIARCGLCDGNGYRGTRVCWHDERQDGVNARGVEMVKAAMRGEGA